MIYRTICGMCRHRSDEGDDTAARCAAFPNGIPDEILRLGFDHRMPFDGDGGIMFEPDGPLDTERIERIVSSGQTAGGVDDA